MSNIAISVKNLSKMYRIGVSEKKHDTLVSLASSWVKYPFKNFKNLRNLSRFNEEDESVFWALKDVSFDVNEGEVLGIIGHNGAGKSTLLKILSKITDPSEGRIEIHGRVSSLLEVGTGFHPELTGRENVYMNGTILGMTKREIDAKFDEIIEFSGIAKHIDTPVKRYSSGMKVRLAFSVAAHLEPEILIIDEVLAVGDAQFQQKCLGKMEDAASTGKTVLFVSHQMGAVKSLCTRGILMKQGRLFFDGNTNDVINEYLNLSTTSTREVEVPQNPKYPIDVTKVKVTSPKKEASQPLEISDEIIVELTYVIKQPLDKTMLGFSINREGIPVFRSWDVDQASDLFNLERQVGTYKARIPVPARFLNHGKFSISLDARCQTNKFFDHVDVLTFELEAHDDIYLKSHRVGGAIIMPLNWETEELVEKTIDNGS